eukprot:scaffold109057_cov75-Phaeocystis_antarctica.AAC.1
MPTAGLTSSQTAPRTPPSTPPRGSLARSAVQAFGSLPLWTRCKGSRKQARATPTTTSETHWPTSPSTTAPTTPRY